MGEPNSLFGFELLQKLCENQIAKKEDILILFVHWYLIKHGFKCIGLGDSKAFDPTEKGSELLPDGWNTRPNYAFRYLNNQKLYIFHSTKSDEDLLLNLLRVEDQCVSNVQFPIGQTVQNLHGNLETIIPSYQTILNSLRVDLMNPMLPGSTAETSTQTATANRETDLPSRYDDPLRVGPARPSRAPDPWNPEVNPRNVGAADLNPFARGGGMLFDLPFANTFNPVRPGLGVPGRLPPGAVPPHARFDPFGPPDANQPRPSRNHPDNDDLPPPDYHDMFM